MDAHMPDKNTDVSAATISTAAGGLGSLPRMFAQLGMSDAEASDVQALRFLDFIWMGLLRHLYTEDRLPLVCTSSLDVTPYAYCTTFGFTVPITIYWTAISLQASSDIFDALRNVLEKALPDLDRRLTRCEQLRDVAVFANLTVTRDEWWAAPRAPYKLEPQITWCDVILVLGHENAARFVGQPPKQ